MSDYGRQHPVLQVIGTRIEVMAELYPRAYLLLATFIAITGYACLLLFPVLVLAGMAGMYHSLSGSPGIVWLELLAWMLMAGVCALVSYRIVHFRPCLPAGIVIYRGQAPALFQLVDDTVEQYAGRGIDRIVVTGAHQLDIVNTPCRALPIGSVSSLVIGLPLMQCLSPTRFHCLLARRLGQFSGRTNRLLNWLYQLREIWPRYQAPVTGTAYDLLPMQRLFSLYAPLYTTVSTPAARLDELQADSYAMELFNDEEVLDAITTDTVVRLFLREQSRLAIGNPGAQDAAPVTESPAGLVTAIAAGLQGDTVAQWVGKAMSMVPAWDDPWPALARRLDNIGHAQARMDTCMTESAAEGYLAALESRLVAALAEPPAPEYPQQQPWSVQLAGLQRRVQSAMHALVLRLKNIPHPH